MIPIYSSVAGGVSEPKDWNDTAVEPSFLMKLPLAAKQFALDKFATLSCEVVVNDDSTLVSSPATMSGVKGSRLTASTTNTSLSNGDRLRSTLACVNVFAAVSSTPNPMATTLDVCFSPVGIPVMIGTKSIIHTITVLEHLDWRLGECGAKSHESRDKSPLSTIHIYV